MHPRVLIVGTVPYNTKSTSRAFDAYFHNWEKENLAQIFSNTKRPCKGHCESLYQITDHRMLKRWFNRKMDTGVIYCYEELDDQWLDNDLEIGHGALERAYRFGQKHTPMTHLLRGILWRRSFWKTKKLDDWLDKFQPECIFLAFSDDYFINWIALYVAEKYNIPIVSCIGDDYYFNKHFSLNPLYQIYKESYRALIRRVLAREGSAIYISDKIRDKYNHAFKLDGETVYLTSQIARKPFRAIDKNKPVITYFGNIRMGRNKSLREIADALGQINCGYQLEVYSNETDVFYINVLNNHPNLVFRGSIPYADVMKRMQESDITIIVEGFAPKDVELSRYSLSTKAADALSGGAAIFSYGSLECGIIEYMLSTRASEVCVDKNELVDSLKRLIEDVPLQKRYYLNQISITKEHHNLAVSCAVAEGVIHRAINRYGDTNA